jgi:hypothetical protein
LDVVGEGECERENGRERLMDDNDDRGGIAGRHFKSRKFRCMKKRIQSNRKMSIVRGRR